VLPGAEQTLHLVTEFLIALAFAFDKSFPRSDR
jgi:hypothetical protein